MGRGIEIRGRTEILEMDVPPVNPAWFSHTVMRIHPTRVRSRHLDPVHPDGESRDIL